MFGIIDNSQILTSTFAVRLLRYVILVEIVEENLASHKDVPKKREGYFNKFQIIVEILL